MTHTVLITGASSGIGQKTAELLAQQNYNLILTARREDRLKTIKNNIQKSSNVSIELIPLDIRDKDAVESNLRPIADRVTVLINSAGLAAGFNEFDDCNIDDWDRMLDTNVKGLLYVSHAILPAMRKKNEGHIVNIGSIAGHEVYPKGAVYCASKHAVTAIGKGLKHDLLGTDIRVTTIDPGMVETEFSLVRFNGNSEKADKVYQDITPLKPEDIAECIAFALNRPKHVNISEMIILTNDQSSAVRTRREIS